MIENKKVLAVIIARSGSKGLPGKNLKDLGGQPLIAWTIQAAQKSQFIDRLVVSTDDEKIIEVARQFNADVPFKRPAELALDDTPGIAPVLHVLTEILGYDFVVLLQTTSPFRTNEDIDACIQQCVQKQAPACVSVVEKKAHPAWMFSINEDSLLEPFLLGEMPMRRQELQPIFSLNGAVYVAQTQWLLANEKFITEQTMAYEMPPERSVDIDSAWDLSIARALLTFDKQG